MDLNRYLKSEDVPAEESPRLSKEEYAAQKKQEREEVWAEIDAKAQEVFKDDSSLKGFLDFMAQCKPQRTANLLLLYSQNPEIRQVKTYEKWKEERHLPKPGARKYRFIAGQDYEKDGVMMQGYAIRNVYDVSDMKMKQPEPMEARQTEELVAAQLTDNKVTIQIADNLPENVQAQYLPQHRTIYVKNGMSESVTFHAINRELACASLDMHDGTYSRAKVSAQAYCTAYVVAQKYGVDVAGFGFDRVCAMQGNGDRDPKELRSFINDVKNAAYTIENHMDHNLGEPEQEFQVDDFSISDGKKEKGTKTKKQPER